MKLTLLRNLKIGLFHLGSGMADVLMTGVWNRIMISDLGFGATPIGLLVSLRYFLAPVSVWAGRMSDQHVIAGYRRLFWIWLGRALMAISMLGLGWITAALVRGATAGAVIWLLMTISLLAFSLGNALSSSTFLALIYDRAEASQRGRAVGIVWTFLLTGFALGGVLFGLLLPSTPGGAATDAAVVRNLFLVAASVVGGLWFFSLLGEEVRSIQSEIEPDLPETSVREDLQTVWAHPSARSFLFYLSLSMAFAFSQDLILEPFAGDVFSMDAGTTTRFAAYWGTTSIVGSVVMIALSRRYPVLTNNRMSRIGVLLLILTFLLYSASAFLGMGSVVVPGLILLGAGLGVWNIGTLGLMMEMSPDGRAGTFLGFWTLVVTLARGVGVSGGGILRDGVLTVTGNLPLSYGLVFLIAALGLCGALVFLLGTATPDDAETPEVETAQMLGAALD